MCSTFLFVIWGALDAIIRLKSSYSFYWSYWSLNSVSYRFYNWNSYSSTWGYTTCYGITYCNLSSVKIWLNRVFLKEPFLLGRTIGDIPCSGLCDVNLTISTNIGLLSDMTYPTCYLGVKSLSFCKSFVVISTFKTFIQLFLSLKQILVPVLSCVSILCISFSNYIVLSIKLEL